MHATTCFVLLVTSFLYVGCDNWQEWWTYDGISGPGYWGLMNPQWNMCSKGRRQSPINVEPEKLLFDPHLQRIHLDKHKVSGMLHNTGQSLVFKVDKDTKQHVNISGGPLAYRYQFEEIYIHYGVENQKGSEHHIHGYSFPAEIQLYGFNKQLYHNMSEAQHKSQGIVGISLMVQIGDRSNPEFRIITNVFSHVMYKAIKAQMCRLVTLLAFLLVVLLSISKSRPSPIACFIKKEQKQPVAIAHGVVLTKRHILTVKNPLDIYPSKNLFAYLGCSNLGIETNVSNPQYNYALLHIAFTPTSNLAVAQTERDINFLGSQISRIHILPRQTFKECHVTFTLRENEVYNYQLMESHEVTSNLVKIWGKAKNQVLYATTKTDRKMKICTFDSGLPVFCEFGVIGLLRWPTHCYNQPSLCHDECFVVPEGSFYTFAFINFYELEAHKIIRMLTK
ncbi:uncharacterized protein LOC123005340 isoform X1 [Tribolium madens]|uniref:uncharacterized protein LOC123005340 isoform X1 n=1 Tax=Tribolium madens TaxID=41895 RepID=UPI001CF75269|nr:uncharacterized protein LOC123005340 isoform X1 [Tribolium madens]